MTAYISRQPGLLDRNLGCGADAHHALAGGRAPVGTIETLLTLPVTETEIVIAKWLGGVVMFCMLLVPFALYLPFLYYQAKFDFDVGPLLTLFTGLTTMGMMMIAVGLFMSSLTRNQIVAAIWTFVILFLVVVLIPLMYVFAAGTHALGRGRRRFMAPLYQIQNFSLGQLDLRYLALHLSVCAFMLFLTVKVLEARTNR